MVADPRRIKELFVAALDLPDTAARKDYLDRACGSDLELRQRLDVLLHAHDAPASVLNQPFAAAPGHTRPSELLASPTIDLHGMAVGTIIAGRYKLVEPIGEGGMGSVWLAQQSEPVKRLVAIKLIKAGMDSKQVLARFEAERQALAIMDHPNIAKVFDGGTTGETRNSERGTRNFRLSFRVPSSKFRVRVADLTL